MVLRIRSQPIVLALLLLHCACGSMRSRAVGEEISFRESIAPLLLNRCYGCHNQEVREGGYSVASFDSLLSAGDSGQSPAIAGDVSGSELLRRLTTRDADERMPAESEPLPEASVSLVRQWIEQGIRYDAADSSATLASILPVTKHPPPPGTYPFPLPLTATSWWDDQLVVGGYHEVLLFDIEANQITRRISQTGERIYDVCSVGDSRLLVASGSPGRLGEVRLIDAASGDLLGVPLVTSEVVLDVAVHPDGNLVAAASADGKIHLLDLSLAKAVHVIHSHSDWVRSVAWSPDGKQLASASRDKTAKVFAGEAWRPVATYSGHGDDVVDVCFVPPATSDSAKEKSGEAQLYSSDAAGRVHRWSISNDKKLGQHKTNAGAVRLLPTSDGVWVVSETAVVLLNTEDEPQRSLQGIGGLSAAVDNSTQRLAVGGSQGEVRIWDLTTDESPRQIEPLPRTKITADH